MSVMLWATLAHAGFEVRLSEGLNQERNVRVPGHTVEELIRVLPPGIEPWTISVIVPEAWVVADLPEYGPDDQLDPAQVAAIVAGLKQAGLPSASSGPEQIAQLLAIVQNGSFESERPSAMGPTYLPPWVLLAAPEWAETLSSARLGVAILAEFGLETELVRYPCPTTAQGVAFGVRSGGQAPEGKLWALPLPGQAGVLYTVHPTAILSPDAREEDLSSWSLAQFTAPDFDPGTLAAPDPKGAPEPATPAPQKRSPEPAITSDQSMAWWLGSGGMVGALGLIGGFVWRQRSRGEQVLAQRKRDRAREEF
ncbi:MAG: hypothetical protein ACI9VR_005124 [Cognaticolwellia sp.]|jgi:hypothetical protein